MAVIMKTRQDAAVESIVKTLLCVESAQIPYLMGITEDSDSTGAERSEISHSVSRLTQGRNLYIDSKTQVIYPHSGIHKDEGIIAVTWALIELWGIHHEGPVRMENVHVTGNAFYPLRMSWSDAKTTRYFAYMDDLLTVPALLRQLQLVLTSLGVNKKTCDTCRCYIVTKIDIDNFPEVRLPCANQVLQIKENNAYYRPEFDISDANGPVDFKNAVEVLKIAEENKLTAKEIQELKELNDKISEKGYPLENMAQLLEIQGQISKLPPQIQQQIYTALLRTVKSMASSIR